MEEALRGSEAALRQRLAALEVAGEKNNFLAILAHELRGSLARIYSVWELLARMLGDWLDAQRLFAILKRLTDQLTWLVADLLDITRM